MFQFSKNRTFLKNLKNNILIYNKISIFYFYKNYKKIIKFQCQKKLCLKFQKLEHRVYSNVTGSLVVASEFKYCLSCRSVIDQFKVMFPTVKIIEIEGVRTTTADTPAEE